MAGANAGNWRDLVSQSKMISRSKIPAVDAKRREALNARLLRDEGSYVIGIVLLLIVLRQYVPRAYGYPFLSSLLGRASAHASVITLSIRTGR